jgi:hypothetical protein
MVIAAIIDSKIWNETIRTLHESSIVFYNSKHSKQLSTIFVIPERYNWTDKHQNVNTAQCNVSDKLNLLDSLSKDMEISLKPQTPLSSSCDVINSRSD